MILLIYLKMSDGREINNNSVLTTFLFFKILMDAFLYVFCIHHIFEI